MTFAGCRCPAGARDTCDFCVMCARGDVDGLAALAAQQGLDDRAVRRALWISTGNGRLELVSWLAEFAGLAPRSPCWDGVFHLACVRGHLDVAQWMASRGAPVCQPWDFRDVCRAGRLSLAEWYARQFEITAEDVRRNRVLQGACQGGSVAVIRWLVEEFGLTSADAAGPPGSLRAAAEGGHLEAARWLAGAFDLAARDAGGAILPRVCERGRLETARWLAKRFGLTADDAREDDNWALRRSCANGHLATARWLAETFGLGASDAAAADNDAFRDACGAGHLATAQWLVGAFGLGEAGARSGGDEALRQACHEGRYETVRWLLGRLAPAAGGLPAGLAPGRPERDSLGPEIQKLLAEFESARSSAYSAPMAFELTPERLQSLLTVTPEVFWFGVSQTREERAAGLGTVPGEVIETMAAIMRGSVLGHLWYLDAYEDKPLQFFMATSDDEVPDSSWEVRYHSREWRVILFSDRDGYLCDFNGWTCDDECGAGVYYDRETATSVDVFANGGNLIPSDPKFGAVVTKYAAGRAELPSGEGPGLALAHNGPPTAPDEIPAHPHPHPGEPRPGSDRHVTPYEAYLAGMRDASWLTEVKRAIRGSDIRELSRLYTSHAHGDCTRMWLLLGCVDRPVTDRRMRAYLSILLGKMGWVYESDLARVRQHLGLGPQSDVEPFLVDLVERAYPIDAS